MYNESLPGSLVSGHQNGQCAQVSTRRVCPDIEVYIGLHVYLICVRLQYHDPSSCLAGHTQIHFFETSTPTVMI
jgi:hypothetical protein